MTYTERFLQTQKNVWKLVRKYILRNGRDVKIIKICNSRCCIACVALHFVNFCIGNRMISGAILNK